MYSTECNRATEWSFISSKTHADPFNDVELDVIVTGPDGGEQRVPAFWSGDRSWRVRYASPREGTHRWRTVCSDASDSGLHGGEGKFEVAPYEGANPLLRRGPLSVSANRRYLEHNDGTPFYWLGDTWWMGLCSRLSWPGDFRTLTQDRVDKGFSVIQIVAGPYPDMPAFDKRNVNEAGQPWEDEYARVNPAYYDMADLRIHHLVEQGLVPCILGCWGYYLLWMGVDKMKQHWRNLVARYGAYPVVWCLAGEGSMPYYLRKPTEFAGEDEAAQRRGWTEVAAYVRGIDPYHHPLTIHPNNTARNVVEDDSVLDIDMLQTGHGDRGSIPNTIRRVAEGIAASPTLPVINGEVCYEGIGEACRQEVQRFMFWLCMLSGACGFTYGANGIWQVNRKEAPFGPSPAGRIWGNTPWDEAARLPGSTHVGLGRKLLERYPWWRFEPHSEWVDRPATQERMYGAYVGGIPREVRMAFLPSGLWGITLKGLEKDIQYRAYLYDPVTGEDREIGPVDPDEEGSWKLPGVTPIFQDWVLVLDARR
ncbi:MAG: DUF4038 domain-containing protein [Candidatus Latescibacteria bacterium]|nr:DUF4038 domain-containing protein [Candidatus Latescibacterota bacterium]